MLFSPARTHADGSEPLRLLLTNELARRIFDKILKLRRVRFRQLESELALDRDELKQQLKCLVDEDLVASTDMPVEDFETYYLTRTGLTTERRLRQVQPG